MLSLLSIFVIPLVFQQQTTMKTPFILQTPVCLVVDCRWRWLLFIVAVCRRRCCCHSCHWCRWFWISDWLSTITVVVIVVCFLLFVICLLFVCYRCLFLIVCYCWRLLLSVDWCFWLSIDNSVDGIFIEYRTTTNSNKTVEKQQKQSVNCCWNTSVDNCCRWLWSLIAV